SRTSRPAVTDEVRTGLYFVDSVFWEALPRITTELGAALAEHYPGLRLKDGWLRLASWIGGDRDGNPAVTAASTAETVLPHRGLGRGPARALAAGPRPPAPPQRAALPAAARAGGLAGGPPSATRPGGCPRRTLRRRAVSPGAVAARRRSRDGFPGRHDRPVAG